MPAAMAPGVNRVGFDLLRVMRTRYRTDDFQQTYFVIESFEDVLEPREQDSAPLYERLRRTPELEPPAVLADDRVLHRGTRRYFEAGGA